MMDTISLTADHDIDAIMDEIMRQKKLCVILDIMLDSIMDDHDYKLQANILMSHIESRVEIDTAVPDDEGDAETVGRF